MIEAVLQNVNDLYNAAGGSQKQHAADVALQQFQDSDAAWEGCVQVLELQPGHGIETAYFFAAQVLYNKIYRHWHRCTIGMRLALRQRLCAWLVGGKFSANAVRRRLCLCLAAFVIRSLAVDWCNFTSELPSFFNAAQPEHAALLVDLLRYLPEELEQALPSLAHQAVQTADQLNLTTGWMMDLVYSILASGATSSALKVKALECLHSWAVCDVHCSPTQQSPSSSGSGSSFGVSLVVLMRSGLLQPILALLHCAPDMETFSAATEVSVAPSFLPSACLRTLSRGSRMSRRDRSDGSDQMLAMLHPLSMLRHLYFIHRHLYFIHGHLYFIHGHLYFIHRHLYFVHRHLYFIHRHLYFIHRHLYFIHGHLYFIHRYWIQHSHRVRLA